MRSLGQVSEWLKGRDCKSRGREAYRGSNPLLPITFFSTVLLSEMDRRGFEGSPAGRDLWERLVSGAGGDRASWPPKRPSSAPNPLCCPTFVPVNLRTGVDEINGKASG